MKNVFLTGGAGQIGIHLIPELLARDVGVTVYDNLTTGRYSDIQGWEGTDNFQFIKGDVTDSSFLKQCMIGHDVVWHLGANTLIPPGGENRRLDFHNNTLGTLIVLETMRDLGIKELLFSSTAAIYGDEQGVAFSEGYGPLHPISLYGASKLACEAYISAYSHLFDIRASIFRFSNVVCGGMNHGVTFDFIQKLRKDPARLEIWGDGRGKKPYFLVDDCIRGMLIAHGLSPRSRDKCETFNLGTETWTRVDDVARIVIEEMGLSNVKLIHQGGRHGFPGDVPFVQYDPSKMAGYGWVASCTSDEAVRQAARRILDGKL